MTEADDEFRPRLGRIRALGGRAGKRYTARLFATIEKATPGAFTKRASSHFTGARIGRGAGLGAAFASKAHPFARFRSRRVAVKIRSVRLGKSGLPKARAHLNYIQRDGAEKEGERGRLYGPDRDQIDGQAFLSEGEKDRHQFRIILSPEDAADLEDLNQFTRDVMSAAENDIGTRLDWVAVNHFDTDHPHVHIVLRGWTDDGEDLVIARSYITHGFRHRAEELATLELGPRRDLDIVRARHSEITREAFTSLDRELRDLAPEGVVALAPPASTYDGFRRKLLTARLQTLAGMKLAQREKGVWRLSPDMEEALKEAGRRGDIVRSMGAALGERLAPARVREFSAERTPEKIIGRVAGSGAADDAHDRRFLALDGADGHQWHVEIDLEPGAAPPAGAVVEASRRPASPKKSDRVIAAIAERHGGIYSDAVHQASEPLASADFRLAHKRRLEALRCAGIVDRQADEAWRIPDNFLESAAAFEGERSGARARVLSWVALDQLPVARAHVFLDDVLEQRGAIESVPSGFGADLNTALALRRHWLLDNELAGEVGNRLVIDRNKLRGLTREAMNETTARLATELGKSFEQPVAGERITGVYRRPIDVAAGRFALVERAKHFTLVPWREALERRRGLEIAGLVRSNGSTWAFNKGRGIS